MKMLVVTKVVFRGMPHEGAKGGFPKKTERSLASWEGGIDPEKEEADQRREEGCEAKEFEKRTDKHGNYILVRKGSREIEYFREETDRGLAKSNT